MSGLTSLRTSAIDLAMDNVVFGRGRHPQHATRNVDGGFISKPHTISRSLTTVNVLVC